jgi:hypothetical protein
VDLPLDALGEALPPAHAAAPPAGSGVGAWLAQALAPAPEPAGLRQRLATRLVQRVAHSAQASRAMQTVRAQRAGRPEGDVLALAPGVRARVLHQTGLAASLLMDLAPGARLALAELPPAWRARAGHLQEWLLLAGEAALDGQVLTQPGYTLCAADAAPAQLQALGSGPARLYLHSLPAETGVFGPVQGRHDPAAGSSGPTASPGSPSLLGWQPLRPGVDILPLHQGPARVSLLARFAAGARVPAHPHGVDEECLMLQGELFLGDLLLCEGDFQFAPAGTAHGDLFADSPCLLFFHGAIDPAAVDGAYRTARGW